MFRLKSTAFLHFSVVLLLAASVQTFAQDKKKESKVPRGTPVMWRDPGDISARNVLLGAGGERMIPDIR